MTHYGGKDLARSFRTVRNNTIQIAEEIPENKYDFRAAPDTRSVGQTLVHIALGPGFQLHIQGNKVTDLKTVNFPEMMQKAGAEEAKPRTKGGDYRDAEGRRRHVRVVSRRPVRRVPRRAGRVSAGHGAGDQDALRDAARAEGTRDAPSGQLMTIQRMIGIVPHLTRQMQERMAQMQAAPQR